jgi:hypothetical protein
MPEARTADLNVPARVITEKNSKLRDLIIETQLKRLLHSGELETKIDAQLSQKVASIDGKCNSGEAKEPLN